MPKTPVVGREQVLGGALDLLRKGGPAALTARSIAEKLACSTQPIYSAFGSMKELERALLRDDRRYYREYLARDHGGSTHGESGRRCSTDSA